MAKAYPTLYADTAQLFLTYTRQRLYELKELIGNATDQHGMFKRVRKEFDDRLSQRSKQWVGRQKHELGEAVATYEFEREMLEEIIRTLNVCTTCEGVGALREIIAQDESRSHTCSACGGKGYRE
jgi:hypothetical protein